MLIKEKLTFCILTNKNYVYVNQRIKITNNYISSESIFKPYSKIIKVDYIITVRFVFRQVKFIYFNIFHNYYFGIYIMQKKLALEIFYRRNHITSCAHFYSHLFSIIAFQKNLVYKIYWFQMCI